MIQSAEIRHVALTDIPYLYEICLLTGDAGKSASPLFSDPFLLGQFYAAPYAVYAQEYSYIVSDKYSHVPSGYIVGTGDTESFNKWRNEKWLPNLKDMCSVTTNKLSENESHLCQLILKSIENKPATEDEKALYAEYPAHFHIDILPIMQGCGCGHQLLQTFLANLREKRVKGVHLGVDKENEHACRFYEKEGFNVLKKEDYGFLMGMKL